MEKYQALNKKLIVKPLEAVTKLGNGMIIQETRGKKDILVGKVILSSTPDIKEGDQVWYPEYSALPIALDGNEYAVIDYSDIIIKKEGGN